MAGQVVGQIILIVDGLPVIHLKSLDYTVNTNRELAVGMSPTGTPIGHSEGTKEYELEIEVYVPSTGDLQWEDISNGIIGLMPRDGGVLAPLFTGCFTTKVGTSFQEKGSSIRKISMGATLKVGLG